MSFIEELKRRNVFRVAAAYLVTAWVALQLADIVLESIEAPAWILQVFMLALALGFPLALVFAWAFEMTPEGLKKEKDVDRSQSITHQTGQKLNRTIIVILALAVVLLLFDRFMPGRETTEDGQQQETAQGAPAEREKSIAVLPFVNMSSDAEQEYFSDGISEEILNSLAKVKELKVAGRTSSFAFKGNNQDLRQIGEALGVEHILEGSVRKSGAKVRITAQLIQVDDGFHLWSETYDRELDDVFAIQDEIASAILEQLKAALIGIESEPVIEASARTDSEVYDLYLLARQRIYERKRLSIESAAELLDKAIAKDPDYAPAYAQRGIAALLSSERNYGDMSIADAGVQGRRYLDKALILDPRLAEAWAGIGLYHSNNPTEHREGIEALEKALAINPNLIDASNWLQVIYGQTGDNRRAMAILEEMVERDPLYPPGYGNLITEYNFFGMQDKSWALLERIRPFLPNDPQILQAEANTWISMGKPSKAIPLLVSALESQPSDAVIKSFLGVSLLQTGQFERVIEVGNPWHRSLALSVLNRKEEAMIIATELASQGFVERLIGQLDRNNQHEQLIEFVESRWPDLAAFESEYPSDGTGYSSMLRIARAYSTAGNESRFNDAMARVRAAHDSSIEQGVAASYFLPEEARYYLLSGDQERALDLLEQASEAGLVFSVRFETAWPEMAVLAGDPRYEKIQSDMRERVNAERAELGLEPIT
jgi:TolB-like protein/Tfp pilus assembly protein PilF